MTQSAHQSSTRRANARAEVAIKIMVSAKLGLLVVDLINNTRTVHVLVTNSAYQCSGMAETIVHGPADSFLEGAPASPSTAFNYACVYVCVYVCVISVCGNTLFRVQVWS